MAERRIPISRRQSDLIDALSRQKQALDTQINTVLTTILSGGDEDVPTSINWRTALEDGAYSLILTLPDLPLALVKDVPADTAASEANA